VRVLRWVMAGLLLGALAGFLGGLMRRHTQPDGTVAYVPPEPAVDEHVAPPHQAAPPTTG
jgi:hypothetical protein